jgi:hypothetical protein
MAKSTWVAVGPSISVNLPNMKMFDAAFGGLRRAGPALRDCSLQEYGDLALITCQWYTRASDTVLGRAEPKLEKGNTNLRFPARGERRSGSDGESQNPPYETTEVNGIGGGGSVSGNATYQASGIQSVNTSAFLGRFLWELPDEFIIIFTRAIIRRCNLRRRFPNNQELTQCAAP